MKLCRVFALIPFLLSTILASSQQQPTVVLQPNSIRVSAEGTFEAAPDTALAQFQISTQEKSPRAAFDKVSKAADQIRTTLKANGIDPGQAEFGFYSLRPIFDYSAKRKVLAYQVQSTVRLELKDFSKLPPIVEQLATTDIATVQSVTYILKDTETAKAKAVDDAFRKARLAADAVARSGKREIGELSSALVDTAQPVVRPLLRPEYGLYGTVYAAQTAEVEAAADQRVPAILPPTAEFNAQKVVVTARVDAIFALR